MKCRNIMNLDPEWIATGSSVLEAARVMRDRSVSYLLIFDSVPGPLRGIVTENDLTVRLCAENKLPDATPIMEIATTEVITCGADEDLRIAEEKMRDLQMSRLVVVDQDGEVVGMVSLNDILRRFGPAARARQPKGFWLDNPDSKRLQTGFT
jgi:CBS domain-containing protein